MIRTPAPFRLRLRVERRAKIVSASAAIDNHQSWYLRCKLRLTSFSEKLFKFKREFGQCVDEQHGFSLYSNSCNPSMGVRVAGILLTNAVTAQMDTKSKLRALKSGDAYPGADRGRGVITC